MPVWLRFFFILAAATPLYAQESTPFPTKPVAILLPQTSGDETKQLTQVFQQALQQNTFVSHPLVLRSLATPEAVDMFKHSKPDGHGVLVMDHLISAYYFKLITSGPRNFVPIMSSGNESLVLAVTQNSPHRALIDLLQYASHHPEELVVTTNMGTPEHFAAMNLTASYAGARFDYLPSRTLADQLENLRNAKADIVIMRLKNFKARPGLRALAIFDTRRNPAAPDIPTAREQKVNAVYHALPVWWIHLNTSPERKAELLELLLKLADGPQVQEFYASRFMDPTNLKGKRLENALEQKLLTAHRVTPTPPFFFTNIPILVLVGLFIIACIGCLNIKMQLNPAIDFLDAPPRPPLRLGLAVLMLGIPAAFTFFSKWGLPIYLSAAISTLLLGLIILEHSRKSLPLLVGSTVLILLLGFFGLR